MIFKPAPPSHSFRIISILLLLVAVSVFSVLNMRPGHAWGDDFALYIMHAKNIVEGKPYGETGFIFNEKALTYSPQNYPPGFPVLLAPVYAIWGMNFTAMHFFILLFFIWMLLLIYLLLKDRLQFWYLFFLLAITGFSPGFWGITDDIIADLPAACFVLLFFYVMQKRSRMSHIKFILLSGCLGYISYSIRATGCLLLPAALIASFIQRKKIDKQVAFAFLLFLFLAGIQSLLMDPGRGYFFILQKGYEHKRNIMDYLSGMANNYFQAFKDLTFYGGGSYTNMNQFFGSFLFVLFVIGFYVKCTRACSEWEIFFVLYLLVIVIFPGYQGLRYLLPLLPFYLFYIFSTLQLVHRQTALVFLVVFLAATTVMYFDFYRTIPEQWAQYRMNIPETEEALNYIKTNVPADAVIMAAKPRAIALFTGKHATVYPDAKFENEYDQSLDELNVTHIFTSYIDKFQYPKSKADAEPSKFTKLFSNEKFAVYKVNKR